MQDLNTHIDPVFEKIKDEHSRLRAVAEPVALELLDLIKEEYKNNDEFTIKAALLTMSQLAMYVGQSLYSSHEDFTKDLEIVDKQTLHRVLQSFYPQMDGNVIKEEDYDLGNLSLRRIFITLAGAMDASLWQASLAEYPEDREAYEVLSEVAEDVETES